MKIILFLFFATFSISAFSQIQQNVNKTAGTVYQPITQIDSIRFNTSTNQMEIIQTNGNVENHTISDIINVTFSGQLLGAISTLDCGSSANTGSLTAYTAASGVSSNIPYTGGNGGEYNGQTVSSTGITGLTATLTAGTFAVGVGTLTYIITGTPSSAGTASFALNIGGKACTLTWTVALPDGIITFLECGNSTNLGVLTDGIAANAVSSNVPYTGGNGGTHNGQTVTSTGVIGLTATLDPGTFTIGSGSLIYNITGTPSGNGTASFLLDIGGQACTLTINVELPAGTISQLDCSNTINTGTLTAYSAANGVSSSIPYSGGNGGTFSSQSITSAGVTGLTANLTTGILANGNGNLDFLITGTPSGDGIATFLVDIGGQTCTLTWTVVLPVGTISGGICTGNNPFIGTLTAYTVASGASLNIEYTGGNGGTHNGQIITSQGSVTGLTATLAPGVFAVGTGNLTYIISGTPNSSGSAIFVIDMGGQSCTPFWPVDLPIGSITTLNCGTATNVGTLIIATAANGVSTTVPYTGGNGGTYSAQSVSSTGVTGLTATLNASTLLIGAGNLTYFISGTPSSAGTASFAINIGGQNCSFTVTVNTLASQYAANSVFCAAGLTPIVNVTNPSTGKIWMDRNLGASQVAISSTDANGYGDLYQWGRRTDGHQCRNSSVTVTLSSSDQPLNANFILISSTPLDWRSPQNSNLWQGINGVNNPCPNGYRLPTITELDQERLSWASNTSAGAFASPLKLSLGGNRAYNTGAIQATGVLGFYWSSNVTLTGSSFLIIGTSAQTAIQNNNPRSYGASVRCIKD
jgi:hypothetical protein